MCFVFRPTRPGLESCTWRWTVCCGDSWSSLSRWDSSVASPISAQLTLQHGQPTSRRPDCSWHVNQGIRGGRYCHIGYESQISSVSNNLFAQWYYVYVLPCFSIHHVLLFPANYFLVFFSYSTRLTVIAHIIQFALIHYHCNISVKFVPFTQPLSRRWSRNSRSTMSSWKTWLFWTMHDEMTWHMLHVCYFLVSYCHCVEIYL